MILNWKLDWLKSCIFHWNLARNHMQSGYTTFLVCYWHPMIFKIELHSFKLVGNQSMKISYIKTTWFIHLVLLIEWVQVTKASYTIISLKRMSKLLYIFCCVYYYYWTADHYTDIDMSYILFYSNFMSWHLSCFGVAGIT